ncbi:hypothetical protein ACNSOL_06725 [Aliarcobacter lanthieri]|uniref:hypothetical protein n=1 Tax=Aliarcobacter lanthieri TaxID=1355374 RepID=UPI001922FCEE|nr:hypothetical protein [Aliarcobacter lanthieri]MBL3519660.1 hypothetical protein [Aliarcobacter lanthieri]
MFKYIFTIITLIFFSGCQQALNEFNNSLEQTTQNINLNLNQNNIKKYYMISYIKDLRTIKELELISLKVFIKNR